jgi:hypothetical protein
MGPMAGERLIFSAYESRGSHPTGVRLISTGVVVRALGLEEQATRRTLLAGVDYENPTLPEVSPARAFCSPASTEPSRSSPRSADGVSERDSYPSPPGHGQLFEDAPR